MIIAMQRHSRLFLLAEGIEAHNEYARTRDRVIFLDEGQLTHRAADLHVFYGHRAAEQAGFPEPFIVLDRGFVRDPSMTIQLGGEWGALATYPELPPRRIEIPEWQYAASKVALIIGQEPHDYSTRNAVRNYNKWLHDTTRDLEAAGWQVRVREHPRNLIEAPASVPRPPSLVDDLRDVGLVVGINSGVLTECFLMGYPVTAVDEHSWVHEFSADPAKPSQDEPEGRKALFDRLAAISWTYPELRDGRAWEAVRDQVLETPPPRPAAESSQETAPTQAGRKASRKKGATAQRAEPKYGTASASR